MMTSHNTSTKALGLTSEGDREAQRDAYFRELIAEGFDPGDARTIVEKTNFEARTWSSQLPGRRGEAVAVADLFGNLPKIRAPSKREQLKMRAATVAGEAKVAIQERDAAAAALAKAAKPRPADKPLVPVYDYKRFQDLPERVKDMIEAHLAIEAADARAAGTLGFMTRALAIATLPHRRVKDYRFMRKNGDFTFAMVTAHEDGLPFGTIPRLLLTWVCTEAVRTGEPVLYLGPTLASYLRELGLKNTGGQRGDIGRLKHAMTTLFSAIISCRYEGRDSWALQNVLLADHVEWWSPQDRDAAGQWQSRVVLSRPFFQECVDHPVPVDLRAMKSLRHSPLALDIYVWLTHRMSYLSKRTLIPWFSLQAQFGSAYATNEQGLRDFKRALLRELKHVLTIYSDAKIATNDNGLVLYPSPTHVPSKAPQPTLPFFT